MSSPNPTGVSLFDFVQFVKDVNLAVLATISPAGVPEAALMGVAVSDSGELIFDTPAGARKLTNINFNDRVAVVIGWSDAVSMQVEGSVRIVTYDERRRYEEIYASQFPNSRVSSPSFEVFVVIPSWVRRYDATMEPPKCDYAEWLDDE